MSSFFFKKIKKKELDLPCDRHVYLILPPLKINLLTYIKKRITYFFQLLSPQKLVHLLRIHHQLLMNLLAKMNVFQQVLRVLYSFFLCLIFGYQRLFFVLKSKNILFSF